MCQSHRLWGAVASARALPLHLILLFPLSVSGQAPTPTRASPSPSASPRSEKTVEDPSGGPAALTVRFEGGRVGEAVGRVLRALSESVGLKDHTVQRGDSVCRVYVEVLGLPNNECLQELRQYAKSVNPHLKDLDNLRIGTHVAYPEVTLRPYHFVIRHTMRVESERTRHEQLLRWWEPYIVSEKGNVNLGAGPTGMAQLTLTGYELSLPVASDALLLNLDKKLAPIASENVLVIPQPAKKNPQRFYAQSDSQDLFLTQCKQASPAEPPSLSVMDLIAPGTEECADSCKAQSCPEVVLIDTRLNRHPELEFQPVSDFQDGDACRNAAGPPSPRVERNSPCEDVRFVEDDHHGTHLAGIMAANGSHWGFKGLKPKVRLVSVCRGLKEDEGRDSRISKWINDQEATAGSPRVYVFASDWAYALDKWGLSSGERRFLNHFAKAIRYTNNLWVVAAGDDVKTGGVDLSKTSPRGPMNLGDLPNVVVVTACEACDHDAARLLHGANYSKHKIVHLAARGKNVLSTASESAYAFTDGTSQATALVAGVAAKMRSCFPSDYREATWIKRRMQVTARPFPYRDPASSSGLDPHEVVAAGMLNPDLALRDPKKDWLKKANPPPGEDGYQPVSFQKWLVKELHIAPPDDEEGVETILTRNVHRIVRIETPEGKRLWTIFARLSYAKDAQQRAVVERKGPVTIREKVPLLTIMDEKGVQSTLNLEKIEDLLLGRTIDSWNGRR